MRREGKPAVPSTTVIQQKLAKNKFVKRVGEEGRENKKKRIPVLEEQSLAERTRDEKL